MSVLYEYYVLDADGARKYFKDIRQANDFAQQVANVTKQTTVRYDIHGGQAWFYPKPIKWKPIKWEKGE
jgi:hypothetical protein